MATEHREKVQIIQDGDFEQRRRVMEHSASGRTVFISRLNQFIWFLTAIVLALLGFRFMLILANANPTNGFANVIYNVTAWLVYPFQTLFANPTMGNGSVIEMTTLLAMVVYAMGATLLTALIRILFAEKAGVRRVTTIEKN
jgi:YggT family protein